MTSKQIHQFLSSMDFKNADDDKRSLVAQFFNSKDFRPNHYIDLLSGNYHVDKEGNRSRNFTDDDVTAIARHLAGHKYNTPANNDKVVDNYIKALNKKDETGNFWERYKISSLLENLTLSSDKIQDLIDKSGKLGFGSGQMKAIQDNKGFTKDNLESIVSNKDSILSGQEHLNPQMDADLFKKMLETRKYNVDEFSSSMQDSPFWKPEYAKKMLEGSKKLTGDMTFNRLVGQLSPEDRHEYLSKVLGMTGGKPSNEKEDYGNPEDYGWNNWERGDDHSKNLGRLAASSEYLSPDHIDFIKRHGDHDEKYRLFDNDKIDPKHHVEMLNKWNSDDTDHGYAEDDLKESLSDSKNDNKFEDFREEAREKAEEDSPFDQYLRDNYNYDDLSNAYFGKDHSEWVQDWINENKPTKGPNPDFDSTLPEDPETNPKEIDYNDNWGYSLEEHPQYGEYEAEAESAFQKEMDGSDTPDSIYENYDHYIEDDVDRNIDSKFDNELDNWKSSEYFLPDHVQEAVKAPWRDQNLSPEQLREGVNHELPMVRVAAASNPNMTPELISEVLSPSSQPTEVKKAALSHAGKLTLNHMRYALMDGNEELAKKVLNSPNLPPELISKAIEKFPENHAIIQQALNHLSATDDHARQVIKNATDLSGKIDAKAPGMSNALGANFNLSPEELEDVIRNGSDEHIAATAVRHPNANDNVIQAARENPGVAVGKAVQHVLERKFPPTADPVNLKTGTHPLRILRDFIDQHGGTISKSKMKAMGVNPSPIDKIFKPNGTVSSKDVQGLIDSMPATPYNTSHADWDGGQRHSEDAQSVFQLNYTQDHVNQMAKEGLLNTFQKIHEASFNSGHPVRSNSLGWVRYTGNPDQGFHVDEIQSDFGQSMIKKVAAQAKEALRAGAISQEDAQDAVKRAKDYYPEEHVNRIAEILFGKRHPSEVLHEGFKEYMRQKGHGNSPIYTWKPESKALISGQTTHVAVHPDSADTTLDAAKAGKLDLDAKALILWGQKNKVVPASHKDIKPEHLDALKGAYRNHVSGWVQANVDPSAVMTEAEKLPKLQVPLPAHMQEGYGTIPKKMKYQDAAYGEIPTQNNPELKSAPMYKDVIRKSEVDAQTRTKVAMTLKAVQDNAQIWEQLQQTNPDAYQALMQLVQSLSDVFKKKSGEDPQAVIHELEIQQQIEEQQAQQQDQQQQDGGDQASQESQASQPSQDQPLHRRQMVYSPGSVRRYTAQDERIKGEDGSWSAFGGGLQDPNDGSNG